MSIDLPDDLTAYVRHLVAVGEFPSAAASFEALVRDDQERRRQAVNEAFGLTDDDRARINAALDKALDPASGPSIVVDNAWLESNLQRLRDRRTVSAAGQSQS